MRFFKKFRQYFQLTCRWKRQKWQSATWFVHMMEVKTISSHKLAIRLFGLDVCAAVVRVEPCQEVVSEAC